MTIIILSNTVEGLKFVGRGVVDYINPSVALVLISSTQKESKVNSTTAEFEIKT